MRRHVRPPGFRHRGINEALWPVLRSIPFQRVKILIRDMKKKNVVEGKSEISQGLKTYNAL